MHVCVNACQAALPEGPAKTVEMVAKILLNAEKKDAEKMHEKGIVVYYGLVDSRLGPAAFSVPPGFVVAARTLNMAKAVGVRYQFYAKGAHVKRNMLVCAPPIEGLPVEPSVSNV